MPPIWVEQSSEGVHEAAKTSSEMSRIHLVIFLDDMLVLAQSKEDLMAQMDQIAQLFNLLGFSINHEKSQLNPTQQIHFLEFLIDSQNLMVWLTQNC